PGDVSGLLNNGITAEFPLDDLLSGTLVNNTRDYRIIQYNIKPVFRNVPGLNANFRCDRGIDTTITIYLNPTPVFDSISISDTAICNESFVSFDFYNTQQLVPGGQIKYEFVTVATSVTGMKDNTLGPYDLDPFTDNLTNSSDSIQPVEYIFTPVIEDISRGLLCSNGIVNAQVVKVAPTLGDSGVALEWIGGRNIRCFGESNGEIDLDPYGGWYLGSDPYNFTWEKDGVPMNRDSASITGLPVGTYTYRIEDVLGCSFDSTFTLTQPDLFRIVEDSIEDVSCAGNFDGIIYTRVSGGTSGYDFQWVGPNLFTRNTHDSDPIYEDTWSGIQDGPYTLTIIDTNACEIQKIYNLTPRYEVAISLTPTEYGDYQISCNGLTDGEIIVNASGSGDIEDFLFEWINLSTGDPVTPDVNGRDVSNLTAGWYEVTVTDTNGCDNYQDILLREPDVYNINRIDGSYPGGFDISCYGYSDGDIQITLSGGHSYNLNYVDFEWSNDEVGTFAFTQNVANLDTGRYYLSVTDDFNCSISDTFDLDQPTEIQYTVVDSSDYNNYEISCFSFDDGFIDLEISGSSGNYSYNWTSPDGTITDPSAQDLYDATAGSYTLTVTDITYNCPVSWDFILNEPDTLDIAPLLSNYNGFNISCYDFSNGEITLNPAGGVGIYNYDWTTTDGSGLTTGVEDQTGLTEGTYNILITDENNCVADWDIYMSEPDSLTLSAELSPIQCFGQPTGAVDLTVGGGVPGYDYLWSNGATTEDINSLYQDTYAVIVTDLNNCIIEDSFAIPESPELVITLEVPDQYNGSMISCFGEADGEILTSVEGGVGDYEYLWLTTGETSPDISGLSSGYYVLQVTDSLECIAFDSVQVRDPLPLETQVFSENPSCYGYSDGNIVLIPTGGTVSGNYTIFWPELDIYGQEADSISAGYYNVTITDLNDCRVDTFAELSEPDSLFIYKTTTDPNCPDIYDGIISMQVIGGTPPYDLAWDNGDYGDYLDNLREGEYVVEITDNNMCVFTDTTLLVSRNESCLRIPTAFTPDGDGINDTWEIVNIDLYPEATMEIFNRWGELIYQNSPYYGNEWDGSFNGREMPIDSYHFVLRLGGGRKPVTGNVTIIR
ncbi:MAG: gliding motility-associated C-terminal domain-containing protein, partial [Bacteroidales bacterium]